MIRRYRSVLYLLENNVDRIYPECIWANFPEPLHLTPDGPCVYAKPAKVGVHVPAGSIMQVKFRTGGEKVRWYGQSQALKTLFQEWGVLPWKRHITPLIYRDECLVAVAGIASDTRPVATSMDIFSIHVYE